MESLLPRLQVQLPAEILDPKSLFPSLPGQLWFEIGFGSGEHLVGQAARHRNICFIGCEPYVNGMANMLAAIDKEQLDNIRLYNDDARFLLEKLPDASVDRLFVLFPDPWPKIRHHKRRIVSQEGLALFYRKLKAGGVLRLATDHTDYCTWMLEQLIMFGKFEWTAKTSADWSSPPNDWIRTRYQAKAEAEGRNAIFLEYVKKG